MENNILDEYEYLVSDLLTVIGTLKIIHRWLDGDLDYYEFDVFKVQYADVLSLAIAYLIMLSNQHQHIVGRELKKTL
ncbi:hypothetical protein [Streptococcus cuniculi]|uniref:Uncharacterized protein n=1 Tax=Streptococcus cuniculi TaxID=1432788 RepID=A0A4Y9JD01_9STRE|nr:hypothetical protein [Streptococcus cuniculi]MBF0778196.1 hypothetical protein [Streptococcus cuniculi]TFU97936.1 hypothetical protein E4T82_05580 [Streptococcus cuniculi]